MEDEPAMIRELLSKLSPKEKRTMGFILRDQREGILNEMTEQSCNTLTWRNKWYALEEFIRDYGQEVK